MKSLEINGRVLQYETIHSVDLADELVIYTEFYEGTEKVTSKKWGFFGKETVEEKPKVIFVIYEDTQDVRLTKRWWRERISLELEILGRAEELERGELI